MKKSSFGILEARNAGVFEKHLGAESAYVRKHPAGHPRRCIFAAEPYGEADSVKKKAEYDESPTGGTTPGS